MPREAGGDSMYVSKLHEGQQLHLPKKPAGQMLLKPVQTFITRYKTEMPLNLVSLRQAATMQFNYTNTAKRTLISHHYKCTKPILVLLHHNLCRLPCDVVPQCDFCNNLQLEMKIKVSVLTELRDSFTTNMGKSTNRKIY